jgi:integrase
LMPNQTFTDKLLRGLKAPKGGQADYWDKLLPGFGIRVGAQRKSFFVGTRIDGRYRRITLKPPYDQLDLATARKRARDIMADAQGGVGPELRKKREETGTFGAIAHAFMQDYAKNHRTRGEYQRKIDVELAEWHDVPMTEISRGMIKEIVRVKARTAPISANRLLALITTIFNWALKEELIESSPAMKIDRPGQETERERSLSADEIKAAWSAFDQLGYPYGPLMRNAARHWAAAQ